jgi:hypothetical protein
MFILSSRNGRFFSGSLRFLLILKLVLLTIPALSECSDAGVTVIENRITPNHVEVPGTGASFATPDDFFLADRFDGFDAKGRIINVIVVVIKSPFDGIAGGFTDAVLKQRGMEVHSRGDALINGSRALFIKALHPEGDKKWGKWIMLLENGDDTIVVNGVFVSGDAASAADVIKAMKSIVVKKPPAANASEDARPGHTGAASDDLSELRPVISSSDDLTAAEWGKTSGDMAETLPMLSEDRHSALPDADVSQDLAEKAETGEQATSTDQVVPMTSEDNPGEGGADAMTGSEDAGKR